MDVFFGDSILPQALSPPVAQLIQVIVPAGVQKVQLAAGTYKVCMHVVMTYNHGTQNPVLVDLIGDIAGLVP